MLYGSMSFGEKKKREETHLNRISTRLAEAERAIGAVYISFRLGRVVSLALEYRNFSAGVGVG